MGIKVNWKNDARRNKRLFFNDLAINDSFKLTTGNAVYIKVAPGTRNVGIGGGHQALMLEVATGKLFGPSASEVEPVEIEVNVGVNKPHIY